MPLFADRDLAARIESLVAAEMREFVYTACKVNSELDSDMLEVAGGVACYMGPGSPVNQTSGMGLREPVGPSDVEAIETFFLERGALPVVNACPLAEHSMFSVLGGRGWTVAAFENVLFRELEPDMTFSATEPGIEIRRAETPAERATWAEMVANGFVAPALPSEAEWQLAHIMSARPSGTYLLAYVDDRPVGTGELHVDGGVGWLSADTTMPDFRGRGIQSALQRERLRIAVEAGCDVAVTESIPGSVSQRNMERLGFRVAYTRTDIVLVRPPV